jgi:Protein of unknown function (DUF3306)
MSDPEHFLARWSRRKRETVEDGEQPKSPAPPAPAQDVDAKDGARAGEDRGKHEDAQAVPRGVPGPAEPAFDISSLPPLDSITAESDIRAFLAPGVPPDLTRAALRRAWAADPKIRDFVGLAEYAWDYHAPGSMAGFGPLEMTDELRRLVARIVGGDGGEDREERPNPTVAAVSSTQTSTESSEPVARTTSQPTADDNAHLGPPQDEPVADNGEASSHSEVGQHDEEHVALQHGPEKPDDLRTLVRRPHGRALPK